MVSAQSVVAASGSQVSSELGEQGEDVVILDLNSGVYHGLSDVAARAWSLVQQPAAVSQVRDQIVREYDVEPRRCENDLLTFFRDLEAKGLIDCEVKAIQVAG